MWRGSYALVFLPNAVVPLVSLPAEQATPTEEGPVSELGSVREKQKASPGVVPGASLPTHIIHRRPNQLGQFGLHWPFYG